MMAGRCRGCGKAIGLKRPPFDCPRDAGRWRAGAYQAGVYQALFEANLRPDWVSGISIGAIKAALIAGNGTRMADISSVLLVARVFCGRVIEHLY
jgi:hypothetical protein